MQFLNPEVCLSISQNIHKFFIKKYEDLDWLFEMSRVTGISEEFILSTKCGANVEFVSSILSARPKSFVKNFNHGNFFVLSLSPSIDHLHDDIFLQDHTWIIIKDKNEYVSLSSYINQSKLKSRLVSCDELGLLENLLEKKKIMMTSKLWKLFSDQDELFEDEYIYRIRMTCCSIKIPKFDVLMRRIELIN